MNHDACPPALDTSAMEIEPWLALAANKFKVVRLFSLLLLICFNSLIQAPQPKSLATLHNFLINVKFLVKV